MLVSVGENREERVRGGRGRLGDDRDSLGWGAWGGASRVVVR